MTYAELHRLYHLPFFELLKQARAVHEANWPEREVQLCTLLSIKTGGCSEDCGYCAQSARYSTGVQAERLMEKEAVMERARAARDSGSTRFCMGAAWKGVRTGTQKFDQVLDIVKDVSTLGMEVCVTLGELGQRPVEMASAGSFDRRRLSAQAAEVVKIDREADLIARGLEEGLTLQELEDLARGDASTSG